MQTENCSIIDAPGASVARGITNVESSGIKGHYEVQCFDKDGKLKWEDTIENLITNVGKNLTMDTILAGSAFTATVVMGLCGATPTPAAGDTQGTHGGWTEVGLANAPQISTSNGANKRGTPAWSAAGATVQGRKDTSAAVAFTIITTGGTVGGCFININGTNSCDNTTGTLFSIGAFTGGNKTVAVADTLNVTYTAALT